MSIRAPFIFYGPSGSGPVVRSVLTASSGRKSAKRNRLDSNKTRQRSCRKKHLRFFAKKKGVFTYSLLLQD